MNNAERVEKTTGVITVNTEKGIYSAEFQKEGSKTVELKQEFTTVSIYPSKKVDSNLADNLFGTSEFGYAEQSFTSTETRVAWMLVPASIVIADVIGKLEAANKNGAVIYKVLSSSPILDNNQEYAISQQLKSMDDFANSQVVRYPDNAETQAAGTANKLILDGEGRVQYRRTFFSSVPKNDMDLRGTTEPYQSAEVKAELAGVAIEA